MRKSFLFKEMNENMQFFSTLCVGRETPQWERLYLCVWLVSFRMYKSVFFCLTLIFVISLIIP